MGLCLEVGVFFMRKKSHISLSRGVIKGLGESNIIKHRYTFYIGSIVPDCIPSFITRRHNMEQTFDIFVKHMEKFVRVLSKRNKIGFRQSIRVGMITHYIADYFTLPHNSHYEGGFKEHCVYEGQQLKFMRSFVDKVRQGQLKIERPEALSDIKQVVDYINSKHQEYVKLHQGVKEDCEFSLETCLCVVLSLFGIAGINSNALGLSLAN